MAINYCDYINGDDTTGDGTFGNPYQKITQASTGLTGGDEVRVAKSPDDSDLSGTLAFVDESPHITTSVDLTGELIPGDFVYKSIESDDIHEVILLTSTTLTLYKPYRGTTETVAGKKLGVTCTGESAWGEDVQQINSSGISDTSRLKISGGWDLTSQTQTGISNFQQLHSSFDERYGNGLITTSKNFLEIEKIGFLRYTQGMILDSCTYNILSSIINNNNNRSCGISLTSSHYNIINTVICNNNNNGIYLVSSNYNNITTGTYNNNNYGISLTSSHYNILSLINSKYNILSGIDLNSSNYNNINNVICGENQRGIKFGNNCYNNIIDTPICEDNSQDGIYLVNSIGVNIIFPNCNRNINQGIYLNDCHNFNINSPICNNSYGAGTGIYITNSFNGYINSPTCNIHHHGIALLSANNCVIASPTCNNNTVSIFSGGGISNIVNNYSGTGNTDDVSIISDIIYAETPVLQFQHFNVVGDNRSYYEHGITHRNTTEARSTQCLQYKPSSDTYYIMQKFCFIAPNGESKNISFYIKDDAIFDGDVQAALFFMEENITGWTEINTSIDYVRHTLIAQASDITEDGVIDLRIKVRGAASSVYVDDLGVS